MQIRQLTLQHVRVFKQATFDFQSGMNLIVGINGAGKSTILDVLRIVLSNVLPMLTVSPEDQIPFEQADITAGQNELACELKFTTTDVPFEGSVEKTDRHKAKYELKPNNENILYDCRNAPEQPLAVYFSTRRSFPQNLPLSKQKSEGVQISAFADSLIHRELRLVELAEWWLAQEQLAHKDNQVLAQQHLETLQNAVTDFLETCSHVQVTRKPKPTLLLDKDGSTLDVRQLSDGERGVLAIVIDLAKRLSQANPKLKNPLKEGKAVVLIDELDLHLHPGWQRTIVDNLTRTFPSCQFIATTHSPQIVGEVAPENILLIKDGKIFRPNQSLGMDTNWILRYLMGVEERDTETLQQLKIIENLIEDEEYDEATVAIDALRSKLGEFPYLVRLQTRIDRILLLGE